VRARRHPRPRLHAPSGRRGSPPDCFDLARQLETTWPAQLAALRASGVPLNAYDNITSRTDAGGLIPEEVSKEMLTNLQERAQGSAALKLFRSVPVGRAQVRFPVLSALPVAYWVTGDTGLKQTSEVNWANKFLNIEELAVIIPIPENVLDDTDTPIWDQVQPLCEEAAARLIDGTVFFGTNAPASFPTNVVAAAIAAGNTVTRGTNNAAPAASSATTAPCSPRSRPTASTPPAASRTAPSAASSARRATRRASGSARSPSTDRRRDRRRPLHPPMRGLWPTASGGRAHRARRRRVRHRRPAQDISWKLLDQAVIQDNTGRSSTTSPSRTWSRCG
jgi:hypothetical protein